MSGTTFDGGEVPGPRPINQRGSQEYPQMRREFLGLLRETSASVKDDTSRLWRQQARSLNRFSKALEEFTAVGARRRAPAAPRARTARDHRELIEAIHDSSSEPVELSQKSLSALVDLSKHSAQQTELLQKIADGVLRSGNLVNTRRNPINFGLSSGLNLLGRGLAVGGRSLQSGMGRALQGLVPNFGALGNLGALLRRPQFAQSDTHNFNPVPQRTGGPGGFWAGARNVAGQLGQSRHGLVGDLTTMLAHGIFNRIGNNRATANNAPSSAPPSALPAMQRESEIESSPKSVTQLEIIADRLKEILEALKKGGHGGGGDGGGFSLAGLGGLGGGLKSAGKTLARGAGSILRSPLALRGGLALGGGLLAHEGMKAADPDDAMGAWVDKNIPGASWIDNQASKLGIGRSYDEQQRVEDFLHPGNKPKLPGPRMENLPGAQQPNTGSGLGNFISSSLGITPRTGGNVRGGRPVASATIDPDIVLKSGSVGTVSAKYESGGKGVSTISSGVGDAGGVSYGTHQLASKTGTMQAFLNSPENAKFADQFKGLTPGSPEFNAKYSQVAAQSGPEFSQAQHDYISRTHYQPVAQYAKQQGLDTENPAIREALYSQSVQHGYQGNTKIIDSVKASGVDMKDSDAVIKQIYKSRGDYASQFAGPSATTDRYAREQKDVLAVNQRARENQTTQVAAATPPTAPMATAINQPAPAATAINQPGGDTAAPAVSSVASANKFATAANTPIASDSEFSTYDRTRFNPDGTTRSNTDYRVDPATLPQSLNFMADAANIGVKSATADSSMFAGPGLNSPEFIQQAPARFNPGGTPRSDDDYRARMARITQTEATAQPSAVVQQPVPVGMEGQIAPPGQELITPRTTAISTPPEMPPPETTPAPAAPQRQAVAQTSAAPSTGGSNGATDISLDSIPMMVGENGIIYVNGGVLA